MTTKVKGYKIDFTNNTIIMNYTFAQAVQQYGSPEYKILNAILKDFPTMQMVIKSGRNVKTTNVNKRLTYANMLSHMSCYENAEELIEQFELVKKLSQPLASPYKYVSDWFRLQFPNYADCQKTVAITKTSVKLVSIPNINHYNEKNLS